MKFFLIKYGLLCFSIAFALFYASSQAAPRQEVAITYQAGQNIRELAEKHLQNPDLWPDILRANGLRFVHQLRPGMKLNIPVKLILQVEKAVGQANNLIHRASGQGAQVLAAKWIGEAIRLHEEALNARQAGDWGEALGQAGSAAIAARRALEETEKKRNLPLEALLAHARGTVQHRPPGTWSWREAKINTLLEEQEKLRTLSNSHAEILFRDDSRLRLNANAELLIQKMRGDGLNQSQSTDVVLRGGDIYALLGANSKVNEFEVKLSDVDTRIDSRDFWVDRDAGVTKVANYDGEIEVEANGGKVTLKANQGTLVEKNRQPTAPKELLPPPAGLTPSDFAVIYREGVNLGWQPRDQAAAYWLEIAEDRQFKQLLLNEKALVENHFFWPIPDNGVYYWRVASMDAEGFPGSKSRVRFFKIEQDQRPPYLVLTRPADQITVRDPGLEIQGETEQGVTLALNETALTVSEDGGFSHTLKLQPGENVFTLTATDPAGNATRLQRAVHYRPDARIPLRFTETPPRLQADHFLINQARFTLHGETLPGTEITLLPGRGDQVLAATRADESGRFQLNIAQNTDKVEYSLKLTLNSGFSQKHGFILERDQQPPLLKIDAVPTVTNQSALSLRGRVEEGNRLKINGNEVVLEENGRFEHPVTLHLGNNEFLLEAEDRAGNRDSARRRITLDQEAPELLDYQLSPRRVRAGQPISLEIRARDPGGMKAVAGYRLRVGENRYQGILRLCPRGDCYRGEQRLPPQAEGRAHLESIRLEDYPGNAREYRFD